MPWTVTRQIQWDGGTHIVEISQGTLDYANADMLAPKFDNEGQTFDDPIKALTAAFIIRDAWQAETKETIEIGHGATWGMSMPFSGSDDAGLREWAQEPTPSCASTLDPVIGVGTPCGIPGPFSEGPTCLGRSSAATTVSKWRSAPMRKPENTFERRTEQWPI